MFVALCRVTACLERGDTCFLFGNDPVRFADIPDGYHVRIFQFVRHGRWFSGYTPHTTRSGPDHASVNAVGA